jgi:hypothetical protein
MAITFKHYARRDGSVMLYINRDNGVSIGISSDRGFSPYGKDATPGKRNAMNEAVVIMAEARPFTGDLTTHTEPGFSAVTELAGGWTIVGTDAATIGGMNVGEDGGYVIYRGHIAKCGVPLSAGE